MSSHGTHATAPDDPTAHADSTTMVVGVFIAVAIGAIATIGVSMANIGDKAIFVHMAISAVQVCIVGYFWMHLKRADALTWLVAGSAFFFMAILFALPLSDYLTRHLGGL